MSKKFTEIKAIVQIIKLFKNKLIASSTGRVISKLIGGNIFVALISILGAIIQARFVSPEDMGYFRSFSIISGYAFFLHLGLFDALQRLYPYYIGKGDKPKAIAIAEICQSWNVAVSVFLSIIFIVFTVFAAVNNNWKAVLGWSIQAIIITNTIYGGYLNTTFRSGHDFTTAVRGSIFANIMIFFITPLYLLFPFTTMAIRAGAGSLINLIYLHLHRPLKIKMRFSWTEWLSLIKIGLPMFFASYGAGTLWITIESTIILQFLGTTALGLWSISRMVFEITSKVPYAIVSVFLPREIETYGKTESIKECILLIKKPMLLGLMITLLIVFFGFFSIPFIVNILIPNYISAITSIRLMFLILPLIILEMPYSLLLAIGKVKQQNISIFGGLISFVLLALGGVLHGLGLEAVIIASIIGRIIRILLVYIFIFINSNSTNKLSVL